jgi:hypothetical protein
MSADVVTRAHFDAAVGELKALIVSLARRPAAQEHERISAAALMHELGYTSRFSLAKWCRQYSLHPIARGVYRMEDFRAAQARAALRGGRNMVKRGARLPASQGVVRGGAA